MAEDIESKAQALFERDPLLGMMTIVVAGNALPGAKRGDVETHDGTTRNMMLPDWDEGEWRWWLRTCIDSAHAMEGERPADAKSDAELEALRAQAEQALAGIIAPPSIQGDNGSDEIGWWSIGARILLVGGRLLKKQVVRVAKWAKPHVVAAAGKSWQVVKAAFKKAPVKTAIGVGLLAEASGVKVLTAAAEMTGALFGGGAAALAKGLGGPLLVLIGAAVLFMFFRRGDARHAE